MPLLLAHRFPNLCRFFLHSVAEGDPAAHRILKTFRVREVGFEDCPVVSDELIASLSTSRTLESLTLKSCTGCGDIGLATLLISQSALPPYSLLTSPDGWGLDQLIALRILENPTLDGAWFGFLPAHLPKLRKLDLSGCGKISDLALGVILRAAPNLSHFQAERCAQFSGLHFSLSRAVGIWSGLAHLHLGHCTSLVDSGLQAFAARGIELTQLDLTRCSEISEAGLQALKWRSASEKLAICNLERCTGISDGGLCEFLRGATQLKELCLTGCEQLSDRSLTQILLSKFTLSALRLENCRRFDNLGTTQHLFLPQLLKLSLTGCLSVTDRGLENLLSNALHLRALDISYCVALEGNLRLNLSSLTWLRAVGTELTTSALTNLLSRTGRLLYLNLSRSVGAAQLQFWHLPQLQHLRELQLCDMRQITSENLEWIARFSQITKLDLSGCSQLDDGALCSISLRLNNLIDLHLRGCPQLTGRSFGSFSRGLKLLELSGNSWLTDREVRQLSSLTKLELLSLQNCPRVSFTGVRALQERLPLAVFEYL